MGLKDIIVVKKDIGGCGPAIGVSFIDAASGIIIRTRETEGKQLGSPHARPIHNNFDKKHV